MSVHGDTAIDACTINAAYAMRQYKTTGSLEVGKRGDLVVLDRDIFSIDADTKVLATYLDGRLVYTAPGRPGKTLSRMNARQLARLVVRLPASSAWSLLCVANCASAPQTRLRGTEGRCYQAFRGTKIHRNHQFQSALEQGDAHLCVRESSRSY